ncbi:MAG: hypothetical protein HN348_21430, partial [Proteobacteria bacterium]|nr:hypothetical protein [Pseudomonadota bacterium]
IMFGLQPSLLLSATILDESEITDGKAKDFLVGGGARSYTTVHLRRLTFHFDTMLGVINGQWNYHLRIGVGARITPRIFARLNYDYRDIVDLTDLDISSSALQGVVLTIGARWN